MESLENVLEEIFKELRKKFRTSLANCHVKAVKQPLYSDHGFSTLHEILFNDEQYEAPSALAYPEKYAELIREGAEYSEESGKNYGHSYFNEPTYISCGVELMPNLGEDEDGGRFVAIKVSGECRFVTGEGQRLLRSDAQRFLMFASKYNLEEFGKITSVEAAFSRVCKIKLNKDGEVDKYAFQIIDPVEVTNERIVYEGNQSLLDKIKRSVRIIGE